MTLEDLKNAMFAEENWPPEIAMPGESNLTKHDLEGSDVLYRYQAESDGTPYAMEVVIDTATCPEHEQGVVHMLNQFAYLFRMSRDQITIAADGGCRRITF